MLANLPRIRVLSMAAAALSALALTAVPAQASAAETGLTLYADTAFTQPVTNITYQTCTDFIGFIPGMQVGSFDNRPPAGCEVILHTSAGDYYLCAGRSDVAATHRQAILYTIRAGLTPPCRTPR
jgi:hypothetical protein